MKVQARVWLDIELPGENYTQDELKNALTLAIMLGHGTLNCIDAVEIEDELIYGEQL